ncbi:MAG: peroxiredoxin [Elusimicrobiota bacterium]
MPTKTTKTKKTAAKAAKKSGELKVGDRAPAFDRPDDSGKRHKLSAYKGKTVVLYFYPKDDTPGCTIEACDFRDSFAEFTRSEAVVLGASCDSLASHRAFKRKFGLSFSLLVDEDGKLGTAYGVLKPQSYMGHMYMGVERTTFVIGPDGKIKRIFRQVNPQGHASEVLDSL